MINNIDIDAAFNIFWRNAFVEIEDCYKTEDVPSELIYNDKNMILSNLSKESMEIINMCLHTPSELCNIIYTKNDKIRYDSKDRLIRYFSKKWGKKISKLAVEQIIGFLSGNDKKIEINKLKLSNEKRKLKNGNSFA